MSAVKVIVNNAKESRLAEELINLLNGGESCNICKNYGLYDIYPRYVFGNSEFINTFTLKDFDRISNEYVTLDELRARWMKHPDSGFTDLATYHKDYNYSELYDFRIKWLHRHVAVFGTEVCNVEERVLTIQAHDVVHATQIWRDQFANANAANLIACERLIESDDDWDNSDDNSDDAE